MAKVTVVAGPPCSGKNAYIEANAQPGDRIVDFDEIMARLSGEPLHVQDMSLMAKAREIRAREIADLLASGEPGWIIATGARSEVRHQYGVPVVVIDPPIDVPLRRAARDRPEAFMGYIRDWYARYEPDPRDTVIRRDPGVRQLSMADVQEMYTAGKYEEIVAAQSSGQMDGILGSE